MGAPHDNRWTDDELMILVRARTSRPVPTWAQTAARLPGRSPGQCDKKWRNRHAWLGSSGEIFRGNSGPADSVGSGSLAGRMPDKKVPQHVLAERAARERAKLEPRSVTAEFFKDPPPGRSALDQKLSGEVQPDRITNPYGSVTMTVGNTRPVARASLYWGKLKPEQVRG